MSGDITTEAELEALYGLPSGPAVLKEQPLIIDEYRRIIAASPFVVVATVGPEGLDVSPRGDPPGFVRVVDDRTLQIPDRRGNDRLDTLRNIVRDPRVALMFLVPGLGEALRANGTARIRTDEDLCRSFAIGDKVPKTVLEVHVDVIFTQCQKAIARSKLWDPESIIDRSTLPTVGEIMTSLTAGDFDGAAYDAAYPERLRQTIY